MYPFKQSSAKSGSSIRYIESVTIAPIFNIKPTKLKPRFAPLELNTLFQV